MFAPCCFVDVQLVIITGLLILSYRTVHSFLLENMSKRIAKTQPPYIEDVMEEYSAVEDLTMLALGSVHWGPPVEAIPTSKVNDMEAHRYSSILGLDSLRSRLSQDLRERGLSMDGMDIAITAGANQAGLNVALALCDHGDPCVMLTPYYFSHKTDLQLAGGVVHECPFDKSTLLPDWDKLSEIVSTTKPKVLMLTTPNNPSGLVWSKEDLLRLVEILRPHGTWIVADQVYHDFLYDGAKHTYPSKEAMGYDRIVHIFSFSKSFGMPGWRVGYMVYPTCLTDSMRKLQDAIPTHAPVFSQFLAEMCLEHDDSVRSQAKEGSSAPLQTQSRAGEEGASWVEQQVADLAVTREAMWDAVQDMGTVHTQGAFYFLVPVPEGLTEDEAVDILARQYKVLVMPGWTFGAPGHMRCSYGSLPPSKAMPVMTRLKEGMARLRYLSEERRQKK